MRTLESIQKQTRTKHTPEPWTCNEFGNLMGSDGRLIAKIYGVSRERLVDKANARLIASAPELLEALQAVYEEMGRRISPAAFAEFSEGCKDSIEAAIAKATGKE